MIEIYPDEPVLSRAELVERAERSGIEEAPVGSWVDLSPPFCLTLTPEMDLNDTELAMFVRGEHGKFRYDYVRLACSFHAQEPERFEDAYLTVSLTAEDGGAGPVAWSVFPLDSFDPVEQSSSTKIGGQLKILSAEIGDSEKLSRRLYSIRGFKEGSPNPYWQLSATEVSSLEGLLRFHVVVRSPADMASKGQVQLQTTISSREYLVLRRNRPFDDSPAQDFHLPAK